jgi:hypothetical protein
VGRGEENVHMCENDESGMCVLGHVCPL